MRKQNIAHTSGAANFLTGPADQRFSARITPELHHFCASCGTSYGEHDGTRCPTGNVSHWRAIESTAAPLLAHIRAAVATHKHVLANAAIGLPHQVTRPNGDQALDKGFGRSMRDALLRAVALAEVAAWIERQDDDTPAEAILATAREAIRSIRQDTL
jgi:hypothetical protein